MQLTDNEKAIVAAYGPMFRNTGGNDIVELIERADLNYFSNAIGASLQASCRSQLHLLQELEEKGLLTRPA